MCEVSYRAGKVSHNAFPCAWSLPTCSRPNSSPIKLTKTFHFWVDIESSSCSQITTLRRKKIHYLTQFVNTNTCRPHNAFPCAWNLPTCSCPNSSPIKLTNTIHFWADIESFSWFQITTLRRKKTHYLTQFVNPNTCRPNKVLLGHIYLIFLSFSFF